MKLFLSLLLLVASPFSWAKLHNLDHLQLSTGMRTTYVESADVRARMLGLRLGVQMNDEIEKDVRMFLDFVVNLETGSNESVGNKAEFEPIETIDLFDGGLAYTPGWFEFQIGALNQGKFNSPLLLRNTAFAATQQKINLGAFYVRAQQAVPSNNQLSKRVGEVEDETPYFGMETLGVEFGTKKRLTLEVSQFEFKNLSANTANISREFGNSINGLNRASEYNYRFKGTNTTIDIDLLFDNGLRLVTGGQYLFNNEAPDGRNTGHRSVAGIGTKSYIISLESFRNESDSSPAFYNSKYYGHNNRQGGALNLLINSKRYAFSAKYVKANVIEESDEIQNDMELVTINLVKFYEI